MNQMLEAVSFATSQNITHRDSKPKNFLVMPDGRVVLSDWELAARNESPQSEERPGIVGTRGYRTPDQQNGKPANPEMDAYALRLSLIEVALGHELYSDELLKRGVTKKRSYPYSTQEYVAFSRSPHSIDERVPVSLSAALWIPAKTPETLRQRVEKATAYLDGKHDQEYFEKVLSADFNELCHSDSQRAALALLTSKELMNAASQGWLKLDDEAKRKLWRSSYYAYNPRGFQDIPPCDAPPLDPIQNIELR